MADAVPFTDNVFDLSNHNGYQFEFRCERCGNGYRSGFERDKVSTGRTVLRAISSFGGGGVADRLSYAGDMLDRATGSSAKDKALARAVETVRPRFIQCHGCGNWVCHEVCWNAAVGQCAVCSPLAAQELSRAQAAAQSQQFREKAAEVDWTKGVAVGTRAVVQCPSCGAAASGGKFCGECGHALASSQHCTGCGTALEGAKFCPECGQKA